jgi:DNA adenine methylase
MPPKAKLRPFFCRIGSKRDIADFVMDYFPEESEYDTYVEPFIGGAAIYWKKEPSEHEVINDLDSGLVKAYRLLKDIKSRDFRTDLNSAAKIQRFVDGTLRTDADKLTAEIVNRCNKWMGKESGFIYQDSNPYGKLKKIDAYQERMKDTKIENMSYEKVLQKYDSPRTLFYLDPPYEETEKTGELYKHGGLSFDYEALRDHLDKVKGYWLLSINDSPNIRRIFKGYYYKAFVVKAKNTRSKSIGSKDRPELLISNYGRGRGGK